MNTAKSKEQESITREFTWDIDLSEIPDVTEDGVHWVPTYAIRTTPIDSRNRLGDGRYSDEDRRPKCLVTYVRADSSYGEVILSERIETLLRSLKEKE